jgi:hypothetical protein
MELHSMRFSPLWLCYITVSSFWYNGYWVFPGGKAAWAWCWPPTPFYHPGRECVELYPTPHLGPWWPVIWWTLPLLLASPYITVSNLCACLFVL